MRLLWAVLPVLLCLSSCESSPYARDSADKTMFGPAGMRIHPIFTEPKDFDGNGSIDGIEALVELTDQFGDSTKASGQVMFELHTYRKYAADPRGHLLETWAFPIHTLKEQKEHWRRIGGAYSFQLPYPGLLGIREKTVTLSAEVTLDAGGRLNDQVIVSLPK
jgi:hypothetical protein